MLNRPLWYKMIKRVAKFSRDENLSQMPYISIENKEFEKRLARKPHLGEILVTFCRPSWMPK